MRENYLPAHERKTILLLSDDCRMFSGIATMSREIILNTCHQFNWIQLGAAVKHPERGKIFDLSDSARVETGVPDPLIRILPWDGYGDPMVVRKLIDQFKPDALMHFTDPRYWMWLYQMEHEIRSKTPIVYYNIWDSLPYPFWNRDYYKSSDMLLNISKQTNNLVKNVLRDEDYKDWQIQYVPHGIDSKKFFPIKKDREFDKFKKQFLGDKEYDFIVFYNARNIRRKNISDIILSWRTFTDNISPDKARKCLLVLHTSPVDENGTDLNAVIETFCNQDTAQVRFTHKIHSLDNKELNYYYNLSDVHMFMSSNEGWGLGLTESLMAGRMIIAPVTGGMQDQMRFVKEDGKTWIDFDEKFGSNHNGQYKQCGPWVIPMFPKTRSIKGSIPTPYISDDTCDFEDGALALLKAYNLGKEERIKRGLEGREWVMSDESMMSAENMGKNFIKNIHILFENWKPRERYVVEKITKLPNNYQNVPLPYSPEFVEQLKNVI
jgi:glycosyltransferase involved in cell wall biosynthesis